MSEFNFKEAKTGSVTLSTTTTGIKGTSSIGDVLQNDVIISYTGACLVTIDYVNAGYMQITAWGVAESEVYPELHVTESLYANSRVYSQQGSVNRHVMWTVGAKGLYDVDAYNQAWDEAISEGGVNDYTNLYYTRVTLPYTADLEIGSKQDRGVLTGNTISRTSGEGIYINGYSADMLLTLPEDALSHANYTGTVPFNFADPVDYELKTVDINNGNGDKIFCQLLMDSNLENLKNNNEWKFFSGVRYDVWLDGSGPQMAIAVVPSLMGLNPEESSRGKEILNGRLVWRSREITVESGPSGNFLDIFETAFENINSSWGYIYNRTVKKGLINLGTLTEHPPTQNSAIDMQLHVISNTNDITDKCLLLVPYNLPNSPDDMTTAYQRNIEYDGHSIIIPHFGLLSDDSYDDSDEDSDNITDDGG